MVFGTYPAANATEQEVKLSAFLQTAWARFAKDPAGGPGWKQAAASNNGKKGLACLGCGGSPQGVEMVEAGMVDARCESYARLFTATTPYF